MEEEGDAYDEGSGDGRAGNDVGGGVNLTLSAADGVVGKRLAAAPAADLEAEEPMLRGCG